MVTYTEYQIFEALLILRDFHAFFPNTHLCTYYQNLSIIDTFSLNERECLFNIVFHYVWCSFLLFKLFEMTSISNDLTFFLSWLKRVAFNSHNLKSLTQKKSTKIWKTQKSNTTYLLKNISAYCLTPEVDSRTLRNK